MSVLRVKIFLLTMVLFVRASTIHWLNKEIANEQKWERKFCSMEKFLLTSRQRSVCRKNVEQMAYVSESATLAREECIFNFVQSKWNCQSLHFAPKFGYDLTNGTRELAVVQALSAASLAYTIASKCATGRIGNCACENAIVHGRIRFFQKVCDKTLSKGIRFAKRFIDPSQKKIKKIRAHSPAKATLMKMEEHNRNVGYKVLRQIKTTKCICPGSTGGCQVKTCYATLPKFRAIAKELKSRYEEASKVIVDTKDESFIPTRNPSDVVSDEELIYSVKSVNPCNTAEQIQRLKGRLCSLDPKAENYCGTFCCGGKYENKETLTQSQCDCKFQWCCKLVCKTCYTRPIRQMCK